nr:MAG TPA_asm: hypothetical protein [Caudoviricetes sp.]
MLDGEMKLLYNYYKNRSGRGGSRKARHTRRKQ